MLKAALIVTFGLLVVGCSDPEPRVMGYIEAPAAEPASPGAGLSPTDPARPPVQAVTDAAVSRALGAPAKVNVEIMRAETAGELQWVFVSGPAVKPDGGEIDLSRTAMAKAAGEGMTDGSNTVALLKREHGGWSVVALAIGPTDVPQAGWPQQYGVSPTLVGQESGEGGSL